MENLGFQFIDWKWKVLVQKIYSWMVIHKTNPNNGIRQNTLKKVKKHIQIFLLSFHSLNIHLSSKVQFIKKEITRFVRNKNFTHCWSFFEDSLECRIEWWEPMSQKNLVKLASNFCCSWWGRKHFSFPLHRCERLLVVDERIQTNQDQFRSTNPPFQLFL